MIGWPPYILGLGGSPGDKLRPMSSIASLHVIKVSDLPAIVGAAGSARTGEAVRQFGAEQDQEYHWSGNVMLEVLNSLDALGIRLEAAGLRDESEAINADFDYTVLITSDAKAFLDRLDPAAHDPGESFVGLAGLRLDEEEAGYALEDTLLLLRDTIARLSDDEVLLLNIG
ncbi:hypothetical protein [Actinoplanes xinjiangensis]|uniref:Uncharacterized protein n=1 Tax=Actinoplanes xinjiangensis TaxID=512350 RepID=A0A316FDU4_9ACTN|nr:hypothetical protein [Actinoplanes xinjiangensis]PWK47048.1 hypothetical protein BC793_108162 [Actinoplanes xinjiangensis]